MSSYNTNGFSGPEAIEKYLAELQEEARKDDIAAAADTEMKDFSIDIYLWGENENPVTISMQIPVSGWSYDENKSHLVESDDIYTWNAGFVEFEVGRDIEFFDFYKDQFENYQDIEDRQIGSLTFSGRTYKNIGYDWTEYVAQMKDGRGLSIGIVGIDVSAGTIGSKILDSISFD